MRERKLKATRPGHWSDRTRTHSLTTVEGASGGHLMEGHNSRWVWVTRTRSTQGRIANGAGLGQLVGCQRVLTSDHRYSTNRPIALNLGRHS